MIVQTPGALRQEEIAMANHIRSTGIHALVLFLLLVTTASVLARSVRQAAAAAPVIYTTPHNLNALRITEIMYNPAGGQEYEFIEIKNTGPAELNISGLAFTDGIDFTFPPHTYLAAAGFAVLARDAAGFIDRYPDVPLTGVYAGALANEGERLELSDRDGHPLVALTYDDDEAAGWPAGADGEGYSLVIVDWDGDPDQPGNWRASTFPNGSPGADDPQPSFGDIVINEVLAHSEPPFEDAIELYNPSDAPVEIGGWFLSDSSQDLRKFRIPSGAIIPARGYQAFYEYQFNPQPGAPGSFALSSQGEQLFVTAANTAGDLTGYTALVDFGASATNVSFGRFPTSAGVDFVAQARTTFGVDEPATLDEFRRGAGLPNAGPLVGPVVINELMYHPPAGGAEFIELLNTTHRSIPLYDLENPANTWKLTDGVSYTFPIDTVLPAQGYALVVAVEPSLFRFTYTVPADVPIFGPYTGALSNGGERVELAKPVPPENTVVPYVSVDALAYDDAAPWPAEPDGNGPSLERIASALYPNEPLNWAASLTAGTPGLHNSVSPQPPPIGARPLYLPLIVR
jgi:hypothetical protein